MKTFRVYFQTLLMVLFHGHLSPEITSDQRHVTFYWELTEMFCDNSMHASFQGPLFLQACNECPLSLYMQVTVILEIMIRKCGFAAVQLVTPEKYKGFLKTVVEVMIFPLHYRT